MPLKTGTTTDVINRNISELVRTGYKPKQAISIAFRKAGKPKPKLKDK